MAYRDQAKGFLGVGWKFPIEVDESTGRIKTSSHEEDIQEAIKLILMTKKGERMMQPNFGCGLSDFTFSTMNFTSISQLEHEILEALIVWEPRIIDIDVDIAFDKGQDARLNISVSYKVRTTNNPYNLVYPYYINEGLLG